MDDSDAFVSQRDLDAASMKRTVEALNRSVEDAVQGISDAAGRYTIDVDGTAFGLHDLDALRWFEPRVRAAREALEGGHPPRPGMRRADGGTRL